MFENDKYFLKIPTLILILKDSWVFKDSIRKEAVIEMEQKFMNKLNWNLYFPTPYDFLNEFLN